MNPEQLLIWLDLEMTGLNPERDVILEIATLVTDNDLNIIAQGPNLVVHQSDEMLRRMDEWNTQQHTASGLVDKVKASEFTLQQAEQQTIDFLKKHCKPGMSPMCGNSIWQDRRFLAKHMPALEAFFHYRVIDVTTVKELVMRWYDVPEFEKQDKHRALDDIRESIDELAFYREQYFK